MQRSPTTLIGNEGKDGVWFSINYGLTKDEVHKMFDDQKGLCPICGCRMHLINGYARSRRAMIDHCEELREKKIKRRSGLEVRKKCVRGLICHSCNVGIGMFKEDINNIINAVIYLQRFNEKNGIGEIYGQTRQTERSIW